MIFIHFKRITPRSSSVLNQELYIFHKSGLIKEFEVRYATLEDFNGIYELVHNLRTKEHLLEELNKYLNSKKLNVREFFSKNKLYFDFNY